MVYADIRYGSSVGEGASNDSRVVEDGNFNFLKLATYSETAAFTSRPIARCRCKLQYVWKFTAASRGPPCNSKAFLYVDTFVSI